MISGPKANQARSALGTSRSPSNRSCPASSELAYLVGQIIVKKHDVHVSFTLSRLSLLINNWTLTLPNVCAAYGGGGGAVRRGKLSTVRGYHEHIVEYSQYTGGRSVHQGYYEYTMGLP